MQVTVVIPSINRKTLITRCLPSLVKTPSAIFDEVIVVFDCDVPAMKDAVFVDRKVIFIRNPGKGGLDARLHGSELAKNPFIFFLDDDDGIRSCEKDISRLVRLLETNFAISKVFTRWPNSFFVERYLILLKSFRKGPSFGRDFIPATFSGMLVRKSLVTNIRTELAAVESFQDVLFYNTLVKGGVEVTQIPITVDFWQELSFSRNSNMLDLRLNMVSRLVKSERISSIQASKMLEASYFSAIRKAAFERSVLRVFQIAYKVLATDKNISGLRVFMRWCAEIPVVIALFSCKR